MAQLSIMLALTLIVSPARALDNGFMLPAMGYSTWNDCGSFRNDGPEGWCWDAEAHVKNVTRYLISSKLASLGYRYVNVDEGWLKGRDAHGKIYEDLDKFPNGMKGLGDWIIAQPVEEGSSERMRYGLYTSRGTVQCGQQHYHAVGSHGYEKADVDWMVRAGARYLKIDSCGGSQEHAAAFADYAKFRDAMNATGERVWFSLCGWHEWYSPPDPALNYTGGASLGNSWRIAGDGSGWGPLTSCLNMQAKAAAYAAPGGWPDPDLLIGPQVYVGGQTDEQARMQFTMWALFPTNLLISQNVLAWSEYALQTYSNHELIAINQDPLGAAAHRIVGSDLSAPCGGDGAAPDDCTNVWGRRLSDGFALGFVNNGASAANVTCDSDCFAELLHAHPATSSLVVRDLWAHEDVAVLTPPFHFTSLVAGSGFATAYKLLHRCAGSACATGAAATGATPHAEEEEEEAAWRGAHEPELASQAGGIDIAVFS